MNLKELLEKDLNIRYIALIDKPIIINSDCCGIIQEFEYFGEFRCGLFVVNNENDKITLKPVNGNTYKFKDINDISNISIFKTFELPEIFKGNGFVNFINKCLKYKYYVENNPNKFYIKYYCDKLTYYNGQWFLNDEDLLDEELFEYFYNISWEYNADNIELKKINIIKRILNYFNNGKENYS